MYSVDFVDDQTGMAVGSKGSVLRTDDRGETWVPRAGDWGTLGTFGALHGVTLLDTDTAIAVGHGLDCVFTICAGFIARTDDGGDTWVHQVSGTDMPLSPIFDVSFFDSNNGIAVGGDFTDGIPLVLRTTNGGEDWIDVSPPLDGPAAGFSGILHGVTFTSSDTAIATGIALDGPECVGPATCGEVILRTQDGGVTWHAVLLDTDVNPTRFERGDVICPTPDVCMVVTGDGTILRSADGGETWTIQESETDESLMSVSCADTDNCIAVGDPGNVILRTADGGSTWASVSLPLDRRGTLRAITHMNATTVIAVGAPFLKSDDNGATWVNVAGDPVVIEAPSAVSFPSTHIGTVVGGANTSEAGCVGQGANGKLYRTEDGGSTWVDQTQNAEVSLDDITIEDVNFISASTGTAVGSRGTILHTTDGGESWVLQESGTTQPLQAVSLADAATGVIVSAATSEEPIPKILWTTDGGVTWTDQTIPDPTFDTCFIDVFLIDTSTAFVVGPDGTILKTIDGGESWIPNTSGTDISLEGVSFIDVNNGVAVGGVRGSSSEPIVLTTADGGATWIDRTPADLPAGTELLDVDFTDQLTGTVVGNAQFQTGIVLRTTDGGETWELDQDEASRARRIRGVDFTDASTGTIVGPYDLSRGTILRTVGGPTFPLRLNSSQEFVCAPQTGQADASVGVHVGAVGAYTGTVALSTSGEPAGVSSALEPASVDAPGTATWSLTVDESVPLGRHAVTLSGGDGVEQHLANLIIEVIEPPAAVALVGPTDGATDLDLRPAFTWAPISDVDRYQIQVATDGAFNDIVIDTEVAGTSFAPPADLESDTQYFWHVQGVRGCAGAWSEVFSFTTETQPLAQVTPETLEFEVPAGGSDGVTVDIANVGTGNLVWAMVGTAQPPASVTGGATDRDPTRARARTRRSAASGREDDNAYELTSILDELLPSVRPSTPAGGLVNCDDEPGLIVHDDGTVESAYSGNTSIVNQVIFVDRFTPSGYPASFTSVCVAFVSQGPTALDFEIVVFDDDGPADSPGTELGALPVSVDGIPDDLEPLWFRLNIASLGLMIDSGSVYIGVRFFLSDPGVFIAADQSSGNPIGFAGGYWWNDHDDTWRWIEASHAQYRSLFVRAVEDLAIGCHDPNTIPWLDVTPNAGSVPAGGDTSVEVAVETTGLDVRAYSANLCISSNDPDHPLVRLPISLTVLGSQLTLDQTDLDFGDVEVGSSGSPQIVTLQNTGNLDATGLDFQMLGSGFDADTSVCGTSLRVGESCPVSVTFTPPELGSAEGTLEGSSDDGAAFTLSLTGRGVHQTEASTAVALEVDPQDFASDGNRVLEPSELVEVVPSWRNDGLTLQSLSGTGDGWNGPEGAIYTLEVDAADYGGVAPGETADCKDTGVCYVLGVDDPAVRPGTHWEATFDETLSDETAKAWMVHIGDSFVDVPRESPFYPAVETFLHHGVTDGCTDTEYCLAGTNTRGQMAVFLLKATEGGDYAPPACIEGEETFADVPFDNALCPWIEELTARHVTSGCSSGNYCPGRPVTRQQMAVFLLRTLEGAGYAPPPCMGTFADVACPSLFADWIEDLSNRGIASGCSSEPPEYCPAIPVTRAQMAIFVTRTFELALYGP